MDAAWHEWSSVALAVMIDGMLAVSAQCGCCHHFHTLLWLFYALSCIWSVWCYFVSLLNIFCFFYGLLHVLLYVFWFCHLTGISFLHMILLGFDVWLFFFVFDITWYMCCGDYGLSFGGESYSSVYVPPPIFVFPMILIICIPTFFYFFPSFIFCIPISWYTLPLVLLFPDCVNTNHDWMKTFEGCMHMHFIICSYMHILNYVYSIYSIIYNVISQDSKVKHVIF